MTLFRQMFSRRHGAVHDTVLQLAPKSLFTSYKIVQRYHNLNEPYKIPCYTMEKREATDGIPRVFFKIWRRPDNVRNVSLHEDMLLVDIISFIVSHEQQSTFLKNLRFLDPYIAKWAFEQGFGEQYENDGGNALYVNPLKNASLHRDHIHNYGEVLFK